MFVMPIGIIDYCCTIKDTLASSSTLPLGMVKVKIKIGWWLHSLSTL
jgi:hypothetical protein